MVKRREKPTIAPTRSEWKRWVAEAWAEDCCAICGHGQGSPTVDDDGYVWQYCATCGVSRALAHEYPPPTFAPEPDDQDDLPF